MARLKSGWNQRGRERTLEDIGGAISFNLWQIAGQGVLDLENEAFQTDTQSQRLDALCEYAAFLLSLVDRLVYKTFDLDQRGRLISAAGLHMAGIMQDNRLETDGPGDYRKDFLQLLNARMQEYAQCQFEKKEGPSFVFLRLVGDHLTGVMGEKDSKWITSYVIDISGHKLYKSLRRVLPGLIDPAERGRDEETDQLVGKNYEL